MKSNGREVRDVTIGFIAFLLMLLVSMICVLVHKKMGIEGFGLYVGYVVGINIFAAWVFQASGIFG